ncbi:MAG TPA: hypothetical protein VF587_14485 [Solirubrobacteraceae bacterium]|jgi:hypothetical protein
MLFPLPRTAAPAGVTIRPATVADESGIAHVAALDSARPPRGTVLVATDHAGIVAALGVEDGTVVADPFARTADVVDLLRRRAGHVGRERPTIRARWIPRVATG